LAEIQHLQIRLAAFITLSMIWHKKNRSDFSQISCTEEKPDQDNSS